MDVILSIIGVLGLGALLIAAWVFVSAAKRNVNVEHIHDDNFLDNDFHDDSFYDDSFHDNVKAQRSGPSSEAGESSYQPAEEAPAPRWRPRSRYDRRQHPPANVFPIVINGERIDKERRKNPDRRRAA